MVVVAAVVVVVATAGADVVVVSAVPRQAATSSIKPAAATVIRIMCPTLRGVLPEIGVSGLRATRGGAGTWDCRDGVAYS